MKVLITGISGALGRMVADEVQQRGHAVIGIDRRPWPDAPPSIRFFRTDVRKRPAEDVFRKERPDAVIHMATVTHFNTSFEERYRINLYGTQSIFEHCHAYGVKRAIFVGRHTVYGAAADAPLYHTEAAPPLAASTFPELADLVAADLYAGTALWKYPKIKTAVLRIVYTLGPSRRGTLASFLGANRVPAVLGFDPLFHLMHEKDAATAITLAMQKGLKGVFNVAGPNPIPLSTLCKLTGRRAIAVPEILYDHVVGRFGFPKLTKGAINHVKYPIVVDSRPFREATGFAPKFDEMTTMEAFRWC